MDKIFRRIVAITTMAFVALSLAPYFSYLWLTEEELNLASYSGHDSILPSGEYLYAVLVLTWLLIYIGLYFYQHWAKISFTVLVAVTLMASFFWGWLVFPPVESAIHDFISLADGAILAMLYFTSAGAKFEKHT